MSLTVYISGQLTTDDETRKQTLLHLYETLGEACRAKAFDPYIPHIHTGLFIGDETLECSDVCERDRNAVAGSCLIVVYIGEPSIGVGIEIEVAYREGVPAVLVYERFLFEQRKLSPMPLGHPAVIGHIAFSDIANAQWQLRVFLHRFRERLPEHNQLPLFSTT